MALSNLEKFLTEYSNNVNDLRKRYAADKDGVLTSYGVVGHEAELVKRGDAHEIKDHMKDSYGAALLVNMP